MNKIKLIATALCFLMLLSTLSVQSKAAGITELWNSFRSGNVAVEVKEYEEKDGELTAWKDNPVIMPGMEFSKILRIYNKGVECYIRAKIQSTEDNTRLEQMIFGMGKEWKKALDGYFYYRPVLKEDGVAELFQGIKIPVDFSQEHEEKILKLKIDIDAIQSKNFSPDFEAESPWGMVEIIESEKEKNYTINTYKKEKIEELEIVYLGESDSLMTNAKDFFTNFSVLMPGDTFGDIAVLKNTAEKDVSLYFYTGVLEESPLLDMIQLKIQAEINGEKRVVYDGNIRAEALAKKQLLCTIPAKSSGTLQFSVHAPDKMDNRYAELGSCVKWVFMTEKSRTFFLPSAPKTGDSVKEIVCIAVVMLVSGMGSLFALSRRKKNKY